MKKILIFLGTRPEAIKLAPLVIELRKYKKEFQLLICSTGQHKQMLEQVFNEFDFSPDINLNLMQHNQSLITLTSKLFEHIGNIVTEEKPEWIIVQGDTTTAMVASLCAHYQKIPVAHVEAGLRSFEKWAPFPEESNRKIISIIADLHFAPTEYAKENLVAEGVNPDKVFMTGNTGVDALRLIQEKFAVEEFVFNEIIDSALKNQKKVVLVTGHRRENFGEGIKALCLAIKHLANSNEDVLFVYPVHLNPNVQGPVYEILSGHPRIHLLEPLPYKSFVRLMLKSYLILTDSGGIQEESLALGKPVLVTRKLTERPEGIKSGGSLLVGTEYQEIVKVVQHLLSSPSEYSKMINVDNPYGDGYASSRIISVLLK